MVGRKVRDNNKIPIRGNGIALNAVSLILLAGFNVLNVDIQNWRRRLFNKSHKKKKPEISNIKLAIIVSLLIYILIKRIATNVIKILIQMKRSRIEIEISEEVEIDKEEEEVLEIQIRDRKDQEIGTILNQEIGTVLIVDF